MRGIKITLRDIVKRYQDKTVLDIESLEFKPGKITTLLGPSGCGKTTTLKIIAGLVKPDRGRVLFDDRDVTSTPPEKRNIGMVFQDLALFPHMTVYDNVAFGLRVRRVDEREIMENVNSILDMVGLPHEEFAKRRVTELSGGQQQRVALARALVKEPSVLLLDEPLSNLDALLRLKIRSELKKLQEDLGITSIYVTHDQGEALAMADTIVVVNKGNIQQIADPHTVYREPRNVFVASFIGNPPANIFPADMDYREAPCIILPGGTRYCLDETDDLAIKLLKLKPGRVIAGFRPEDATISSKPVDGDVMIVGEVFTVEPLGRESIVTIVSDGVEMKVIAPPDVDYKSGDVVYVNVDKDKILLFDPETEVNLKYIDIE